MQESEAWLRSPEPLVQKHCPAQQYHHSLCDATAVRLSMSVTTQQSATILW